MQRTSEFENLDKGSDSPEDDSQTSPFGRNEKCSSLTQEQLERINTNKKRAIDIRQSKERVTKKYWYFFSFLETLFIDKYYFRAKTVLNSLEPIKLLDTGAGFYLDEEDLIEEKESEKNIVETPRKLYWVLFNFLIYFILNFFFLISCTFAKSNVNLQ